MPLLIPLNKEETERISKYRNTNYKDFYNNSTEKDLYKTAKAERKAEGLPKAKFNPEDETTYKNRMSIKPVDNSVLSNVLDLIKPKVFKGLSGTAIDLATGREKTKQKVEALKPILTPVNTVVGRGLDLVDTPVKRAVSSTSSALYGVGANAKELVSSIREDREFDWLKAGEEWEDANKKIEYLWGVNNELSDYLNFKTSEEKRQDILRELPPQKQKEYKEQLGTATILTDVIGGLTSGLLTGGAASLKLGQLAKNGGNTAKLANATKNIIDKTPSGLALLGGINAVAATTYYGATGKWIFEGDQAATEGAFASGIVGLFKSLGLGKSLTKEEIDTITSNKDFQKGFNKGLSELKESGVIKEPKIKTKVEEKYWRNKIDELETTQKDLEFKYDSGEYSPKFDILSEGYDKGLVKFNGIDDGKYSFSLSDELGKIKFGKKYDPTRPLSFHYPIEDFNKRYGKDIIDIETRKNSQLPDLIDDINKQLDEGKETPKKEDLFTEELNKPKVVSGEEFSRGALKEAERKSKVKGDASVGVFRKLESLFVNNKTKLIGKLYGDNGGLWNKADRKYRDILDAEEFNQKANFINKEFENLGALSKDEFQELNTYIGAKSRLNQIKQYGEQITKKKSEADELLSKEVSLREEINKISARIGSLRNKLKNTTSDSDIVKLTKEITKSENQIAKFGKELGTTKKAYSELTKEISEKGELKTAVSRNGEIIELTKEQLEKNVKDFKDKWGVVAERLNNVNKNLLDFEVSAGIRTQDEVDNFLRTNPDYVPAKLSDDELEKILKGDFKLDEGVLGNKSLVGGSAKKAFSEDGVNDLYRQYLARIHIANKHRKATVLKKIDEGYGFFKEAKDGNIPKGYKDISIYENGELKRYAVPEIFSKYIDDTNTLSDNGILKTLSIPTNIIKRFATGTFNPVFQVLNFPAEVVNGVLAGIQQYGIKGGKNYLKKVAPTLLSGMSNGKLGDEFTNSKEGIDAINGLMEFWGGTYSKIDLIGDEVGGNKFHTIVGSKNDLGGTSKKVYKKTKEFARFGGPLEKYGTRMPLFNLNLQKQFDSSGIDSSKFTEWAREAGFDGTKQGSIQKLTDKLISEGIDPRVAGSSAKGLFNYTLASKGIREGSRIFGYLNTAVSGVGAISRLYQTNPKRALAIIGTLWTIGDTIASYNTGTSGVAGLQEDKDKQSAWLNSPSWLQHSLGFQSFSDDEFTNTPLFKNVNILNWLYPIIIEKKKAELTGEDPSYTEGVAKIVKDSTYFIDPGKDFEENLKSTFSSAGFIKPAAELIANKDLFSGKTLSDKKKIEDGLNLYDTKNATVADVTLAVLISKFSGMTKEENGYIVGGISPSKVATVLDYIDPQNKVRNGIQKLYERYGGNTEGFLKSKELLPIFTKVYKNDEFQKKMFEVSDEELKKSREKGIIDISLDGATTLEGVIGQAKNLIKEYPDKKKTIETKAKNKILEVKYGKDIYSLLNYKTNEEAGIFLNKNFSKEEIINILKEVQSAGRDGLVSKDRYKNILEEVLKSAQKKTQ